MDIGICSYSFHRALASGKQDIFGFINACKELGCTQLDPWNAHLAVIKLGDAGVTGPEWALSAAENEYLDRVESAADESGLPWGTLAVDGAHIYDADESVRAANRARAYRWLEVADRLGCEQVRIDAGGPEEMPDDAFKLIVDGYNDLIARAKEKGIEIITENHFGPSRIPANVERMMQEIEGLGFLYDTHNWKPELLDEGRQRTAKYATATHVKTFAWDAGGNETSGATPEVAIQALLDAGYNGAWGIESVPTDGDETEGARKTIALIRRAVG
ncbi:MAG: TIM barrel protein [Tepidisphaeraceae bacterium]